MVGVAGGAVGMLVGSEAIGARARRNETRRMTTHVAGVPYRIGLATPLDSVFFQGQTLRAVRELDNAYDAHGIALYAGADKLGYVPRRNNRLVSYLLDEGRSVQVRVLAVEPEQPWEGVRIEITW